MNVNILCHQNKNGLSAFEKSLKHCTCGKETYIVRKKKSVPPKVKQKVTLHLTLQGRHDVSRLHVHLLS